MLGLPELDTEMDVRQIHTMHHFLPVIPSLPPPSLPPTLLPSFPPSCTGSNAVQCSTMQLTTGRYHWLAFLRMRKFARENTDHIQSATLTLRRSSTLVRCWCALLLHLCSYPSPPLPLPPSLSPSLLPSLPPSLPASLPLSLPASSLPLYGSTEDVDPTVGKFRNMVQTTILPNKKRKTDNAPLAPASLLLPSPSLLSHLRLWESHSLLSHLPLWESHSHLPHPLLTILKCDHTHIWPLLLSHH